jgi:hypothetical protein
VSSARRSENARSPIEDVLAANDLEELLDEVAVPGGGSLRGRRWHCPVPGHDDQHPSVTMRTDGDGHQRWRCWSGDDTHRGDAIDLLVVARGLSTGDAIGWLTERARLPRAEMPHRHRSIAAPESHRGPPDPAVEQYVAAAERILWARSGRDVLDWLHRRGLDDEILRANRVGADPGRDVLSRGRGLPHGTGPAAVYPALDQAGAVAYVQARYLEPNGGPKYDNPARTLAANPKIGWTRTVGEPIPGALVVCEGIPDALIAAQMGHRSVAILGAFAITPAAADEIGAVAEREHCRVVSIIDADSAGHGLSKRLDALLAARGRSTTAIEPSPGRDLTDWSMGL